jgi:hypothetical protein
VSAFATEFEFTLPMGYVDDEGTLHREGTMRLATAADEILPLRDPRVRANESYLTVILLSRVVTRLGSLPDVTPATVEGLFVPDLAHLQELYGRVNTRGVDAVDVVCPECGETFELSTGGDAPAVADSGRDRDRGHAHGHAGGPDADASPDAGREASSTADADVDGDATATANANTSADVDGDATADDPADRVESGAGPAGTGSGLAGNR